MWVARCDTYCVDLNLSPKFKNVIDCQNYIDTHLKVLEFLIMHMDNLIYQNCDKHRKQAFYSRYFEKTNNFIRCYNLTQKRFADGFDF